MRDFIIVETEDGLTVTERRENETAEAAAVRQGGVIVDVGPYGTHDDAMDALMQIPTTAEEGIPDGSESNPQPD